MVTTTVGETKMGRMEVYDHSHVGKKTVHTTLYKVVESLISSSC